MRWALVKNNIVLNVIEADQSFVDKIRSDYDYCIQEPLELDAGSVGDAYDPNTGNFTRPLGEQ